MPRIYSSLKYYLGIMVSFIMLFILTQCQPQINGSLVEHGGVAGEVSQEEVAESINDATVASFLREQGILYIRGEYHQAQMGLSMIKGGGELGPLTTSYEWWLDVQNPSQMRRATTEWLEDGPHIVGADGADGTEWWQVDARHGMVEPAYQEGASPFEFAGGLKDMLQIVARGGQEAMTAVQQGEATVVEQREQAPWGQLSVINYQQTQTGHTITATVRAEEPFILVERVTVDSEGQLFETMQLTDWEWLDPADLPADFWLSPPAGVPISP